jgi:hypothetical protein
MLFVTRVPEVARVGMTRVSPTARVLGRERVQFCVSWRWKKRHGLVSSLLVPASLADDGRVSGRNVDVEAAAVVLETLQGVVGELRRKSRVEVQAIKAETVAGEAVRESPVDVDK